jgi:hypothetical protein
MVEGFPTRRDARLDEFHGNGCAALNGLRCVLQERGLSFRCVRQT